MKKLKRVLLTMLLLIFAFFLCFLESDGLKKNHRTTHYQDIGLSREQLLPCVREPSEYDKKIADKMMQGELTVGSIRETLTYNLETFDWNVQHSSSPGTFQLYLQGLEMVRYLTSAYELTEEIDYLKLAKKFIYSWSQYGLDELAYQENAFAWGDHVMAERTINLIYFYLEATELKGFLKDQEKEELKNFIEIHAERLSNSSYYTMRSNHGVMQDRALICAALFLNNELKIDWLDLAAVRLLEQYDFIFGEELVCSENAFDYFIADVEMFETILEIVEYDETVREKFNMLKNGLEKSKEITAYFLLPNGYSPIFGDSVLTNEFPDYMLKNNIFLYSSTQGKQGKKPGQLSMFLPQSGYYISREHWRSEDFTNSAWLMFKAGYQNINHKHADELSFMYYVMGHEVFTDCGYYNYTEGWPREYLISAKAHNNIIVDDIPYELKKCDFLKTGFSEYENNLAYGYEKIKAYNYIYNGIDLSRTIYNFGDAFIIHDMIRSSEKHKYTQLFHLAEGIDIEAIGNNKCTLDICGRGKVIVEQLNAETFSQVYTGENEEQYGYRSKKFNEINNIFTLTFFQEGTDAEFVTIIRPEKSDNRNEVFNATYDEEQRTVLINKSGKEFQIVLDIFEEVSITPFEPKCIQVKNVGEAQFSFKDHTNYDTFGDVEYAWYIIDKNSGERLYSQWYTKSNEFNYIFERGREYEIMEFVYNGDLKNNVIIGGVTYNNDTEQFDFKEPKKTISMDEIIYMYN